MKGLLIVALFYYPGTAFSHAVLMPEQVRPGSYERFAIKIGHGCEGSPTTQIVLEVPEGVQDAKPMPKPGWTIEISRSQLDEPYESHGHQVTEDVSQIVWSDGRLLDQHYDEFVFHARLRDKPGRLYLPVRQVCEQGEMYWHQIPESDHSHHRHGKELPAPALELLD